MKVEYFYQEDYFDYLIPLSKTQAVFKMLNQGGSISLFLFDDKGKAIGNIPIYDVRNIINNLELFP